MVLLIVNFKTGDESVSFYDVAVLIETETIDRRALEKAFSSCEIDYEEDDYYEECVKRVLNGAGYKWSFLNSSIPQCNRYYQVFVSP